MDAINVATFVAYIVLQHAPLMRRLFQQEAAFNLADRALTQYLTTVDPRLAVNLKVPLSIARGMPGGDLVGWKKQKVVKPAGSATNRPART